MPASITVPAVDINTCDLKNPQNKQTNIHFGGQVGFLPGVPHMKTHICLIEKYFPASHPKKKKKKFKNAQQFTNLQSPPPRRGLDEVHARRSASCSFQHLDHGGDVSR